MTEPLDALLAGRGFTIERAVLRAGMRGIVVASGPGRALVTVVGPRVDPASLVERPGWDLPLRSIDESETESGPRTFIAEDLPSGIPSTWIEPAGGTGAPDTVPAFAIQIARKVSAAHEAGALTGPLRPELVLVDPSSGALTGHAQRPLRADAGAAPIDGAARFFGAAFLTPAEVQGRSPDAPDEVFRLAALVWRWRHGSDPFAASLPERMMLTLAGTPTAVVTASGPPDEVDRLLLRAFDPIEDRRPSAPDLATALAGIHDGWRPRANVVGAR